MHYKIVNYISKKEKLRNCSETFGTKIYCKIKKLLVACPKFGFIFKKNVYIYEHHLELYCSKIVMIKGLLM